MTDYKLVPIGPTPEMVSAAEYAYMPFGDMEMAIRMAVLAAPAVQQPAPDVEALVAELERSVAGFAALSGMASLDAGARNYARQKAIELNASLAAHRKLGGDA